MSSNNIDCYISINVMLLAYVFVVKCTYFNRVTCRIQVDAVLKDIREHLAKELEDKSNSQTLSSESTIKSALQNLLSSSSSSASVPAASHKVSDCEFTTIILELSACIWTDTDCYLSHE